MTLAEMREEFYDNIGQDASFASDAFDHARANRLLNRSARAVYTELRVYAPEEFTKTGTVSVTSGTREYNLATLHTNFLDLHKVEQTNSDGTRPFPLRFDRTFDRGADHVTDNPLYLRNTMLGYYDPPTAATTLTIHYAPKLTAMTLDTHDYDNGFDFTNMPRIRDEFHEAIVLRATYRALGQEAGAYEFWQVEYAAAMARHARTLKRRRPGPRQMARTDWMLY